MSEIVNYKSVSISTVMNNLSRYKYNPTGIQRTILDLLEEITEGSVDIVDPTNPFVFLLESSAINTALAINESVINLRKQYPSLAQTEEDVYLHMSDVDFVNRFGTPSTAVFTFMINYKDIVNTAVYDDVERCYKVIIPRDTTITVNEVTFTLSYPIEIRRFINGLVQVSRDAEITSPLETLTSNIVTYTVRRDKEGVDWILFEIPIQQFKISSNYYTLQQSVSFSERIIFEDQYYYCRVYNRSNSTNNKWIELLTTHTDQVYDPFTPTAVIKKYTNYCEIFIPSIYITSNKITGDIRIDMYVTKGNITVNLSDYKLSSFESKLTTIDEERDLNVYTKAMAEIGYITYSSSVISGGTDEIDFKTLRERVIFNSVGDRQLPITNIQLEAFTNNKGFDLVKNVDVVTNRLYLATKKLPKPLDTRLITSASIGISSFITNIEYLKTLQNVVNNNNRITILSNNLYINKNGIVSILTKNEIDAIKALPKSAMVSEVNSKQYMYSPFYYVLDSTQKEFELRAYNLDQPVAKNISFLRQNETLQLPVNTSSYNIIKTNTGYRITIKTISGNFYKQLSDSLVQVQLGYYSIGENTLAYINGHQIGTNEEGERIFTFDIETNHDIDNKDYICITNGKMFSNENIKTWINLQSDFYIFHTTSSVNSNFIADDTDSLIGKFILPPTSVGNTHEKINITLGYSLKNIWSRSRTMGSGLTYQTHAADVPLLYNQIVYETDPTTGSIFSINSSGDIVYNIIHNIGDPVLNIDNEPVYKYRKGDVVLDEFGNPVVENLIRTDKELDILFVDGKYYFADDASFVEYKNEIMSIITNWITQDIKYIQDVLIEQTKIYFYPKTTLGLVKVFPDSITEDQIKSEQSFIIDLYVKDKIYKDNNIRQQLINGSIKILDDYISNMTINITELLIMLKNYYNDSVDSVEIKGLGGDKNYQIINIAQEHNRLCLKKNIVLQQDNTIIIKEDVTVNFYNIERVLETST
jgi:hypothetical protein